jgi:DNA end-binding protein Ku
VADGRRKRGESRESVGAAARAFWSGTLSFGLVSIPVELMTATARRGVSMRMLTADGMPLRRRYMCPRDGTSLSSDDLVRGYEVQRGQFITVTDDELEALEPEKSRDINLRRFVPRESIPPLFFERAYFLAPSGASSKAYHLLTETMERTGRAGVATFVMRGKEYLIAILAEGGVLRGEILRFHDEVRTPDDVGLPAPHDADPRRVEAIERDIDELRGPLDREELRDEESEALRELARHKHAEGRDVVRAPEMEEEIEEAGQVVDLMQILKERLGAVGERAPAKRAEAAHTRQAPQANGEGGEELTKEELYERARELGIRGRSKMSKEELADAVRSAG